MKKPGDQKSERGITKWLDWIVFFVGMLFINRGVIDHVINYGEGDKSMANFSIVVGICFLIISSFSTDPLIESEEQNEKSRLNAIKQSRKPLKLLTSPFPYLMILAIIPVVLFFKLS